MTPWHRFSTLAATALLGCGLDTPPEAAPVAAPSDAVADALRLDEPSPFAAPRTVALDLKVRLHDGQGSLPPSDHLVVASLERADGTVAWRGAFGPDGRLRATVAVPADAGDMVLFLDAPGFLARNVAIPAMSGLSEASRTLVLVADPNAVIARDDNDRDGVPAALDADPRDPLVTFTNAFPSEGAFTVAFEDMFQRTRAGDADFNDFVADYRVTEHALRDRISRIEIEAVGRSKTSGYDHAFGTTLRFDGAAAITVAHFASTEAQAPDRVETFTVADGPGVEQAVVELFHSTRRSVGRRSVATIAFADPVDAATLTRAPYDPYLYVWNTGHDVHLAGQASLPRAPHLYTTQKNTPDAAFVDDDGFPFALLVPSDWDLPADTQYVGRVYPEFDAWRVRLDGAVAGTGG